MNCKECQEDLVAHLEGLLTPRQEAELQGHLRACGACRAELAAFRDLQGQLARHGHAMRRSQAGSET